MIFKHLGAIKIVSCLSAVLLLLAGCATPGQGPVGSTVAGGPVGCGAQATTQSNKTLSGALIGAGAGTVLGAATGGRGRIAGGAALGALVGAGIGAYMDQQETALRNDLAGSGIIMARSGDNIILTLPEGVLFASGKSALSSQSKSGLNRLAGSLNRFEKTTVTVCGHTDSVGSRATNLKLSNDRARVVADYLGTRGVARQRLNYEGYADDMPVGSNSTASGRALNRRVEVLLKPIPG